ncbi:MAG: hypothetical protein QNL04_06605 [SAR324 cluster bacterium]|nr:hypothetical protein [SAR324 cluster bacterium]
MSDNNSEDGTFGEFFGILVLLGVGGTALYFAVKFFSAVLVFLSTNWLNLFEAVLNPDRSPNVVNWYLVLFICSLTNLVISLTADEDSPRINGSVGLISAGYLVFHCFIVVKGWAL